MNRIFQTILRVSLGLAINSNNHLPHKKSVAVIPAADFLKIFIQAATFLLKMYGIVERYFFAKRPPCFPWKMNYIVEGYFLLSGRRHFLFTIRFRLWIIRSIAGCVSWYMNAVTMTAATVFFWTMGRNAFVCRVFPIRYSVNGFAMLFFRWTSHWKQRCCSETS